MIATNIGRTFLNAYNEKYKKSYSAKEFFVEVYFSLFFDHEKYMQWVTNSPFNPGNHLGDVSAVGRQSKLQNFINSISQNKLDEKNVIGFSVLDPLGTTSGQITNMKLPIGEEEAYFSWIGSGFGLEMGGISMLIDNKQLLLDIFDGWQLYRNFLNNISQIEKGNQIDKWNSQWISHKYDSRKYDVNNPTAHFTPLVPTKTGKLTVGHRSWVEVLVGLAKKYPNTVYTSYVYKLGFNTPNTTIGFIEIFFPMITYTFDLYIKYFGTTDNEKIKKVFGTAIGFTKACQMGAIGVNALEPSSFKDYFKNGKIPKYDDSSEEKKINFNTYQIWLLAMLNNENLWEQAHQIAETLSDCSKSKNASEKKSGAKTDKRRDVEKLLASVNKKQFIDGLTTLVEDNQDVENLNQIAQMIHSMPVDNVSYFLTLIRFQYAVVSKKS